MSAEVDPARLVWRGFDGTSLPPWLSALIRSGSCGGIVLFRRNVGSPVELWKLCTEAAASNPGPGSLPVAIDQEGGRVARLREPDFTGFSAARTMAGARDESLLERAGAAMGEEMAACGINVDFAPVLDVQRDLAGAIGDRTFGGDPDDVWRFAGAWARGLASAGVQPCAKHFPGHGDASCDSHLDLPTVSGDTDAMERAHLAPYREAISRGGIGAIMVGHLLVPWIDTEHPATLSPGIVGGLLRSRMGYEGLVVTDDMEMGAISRRFEPGEAAALAVEAGCDVLLWCSNRDAQDQAVEALRARAASNKDFAARVETSLSTLDSFCSTLGCPPAVFDPSKLRTPAHLEIARMLGGGGAGA